MSLVIKTGAGGESTLWTIDGASKAGRVTLYDALGNPVQIADRTALSTTQKGNIIMGSDGKLGRVIAVDKYGKISLNQPVQLWLDPVLGAAVNTVIWAQSLTTQTMSQANGSILFNASALVTTTTGSMVNSVKQFFKKPKTGLATRFTKVQFNHYNNAVIEMGFGLPASAVTATPLVNGAFLRMDTDGTIYLVVASNGTEKLVSAGVAVPNRTDYYTVEVMVYDDKAEVIVFDSSGIPIIELENTYDVLTQASWTISHLPIFARTYNNTAPVSAPSLRMGITSVFEMDVIDTEPLAHKMVGMGKGLFNNPFTTFGQLANYTNNGAPTTRTPSNTAAGESTLGGHISWSNGANSFAASDTLDLLLFGYQNVSPLQMVITDLMIESINLGAANGAAIYTLEFFVAINATAVSLATATYSRQVLGFQSLAAAAGIGAKFDGKICESYQSPIVVEPGRFFAIGVRVVGAGVATASQVIRTAVTPKGYFKL